ncbi:hypothetical protein [Neobacillus dielmonensis]|uniref:hypothetical protein n=1 Tax=Neobacillus dielmonensis TaxID=1347369 RepID=UPI0005A7C86B|nr:hypothetical protein [Neobacillus dielmonensis]
MEREVLKINPHARKVLHVLSLIGTFMMVFGFLYLVQKYTIGLLFRLNKVTLYGFPIHMIIYTCTSLIFMKKFIKLSSPYKDDD